MTEYRFHWWPTGPSAKMAPSIALEAQSTRHGAAIALQHFVELGCDLRAAGAHLDVTDPDGHKHTMLVDEVLDWLKDDAQGAFVRQQRLAPLFQGRTRP